MLPLTPDEIFELAWILAKGDEELEVEFQLWYLLGKGEYRPLIRRRVGILN
jgi:hypothetical protein